MKSKNKYKEYAKVNYNDLYLMKTKDLKKLIQNENNKANRNLHNLIEKEKQGYYVPALQGLANYDNFKLDIKKYNKLPQNEKRNYLINKMLEVSYFNNLKTSNIRGLRRFQKQQIKQANELGIKPKNIKSFWSFYQSLKNTKYKYERVASRELVDIALNIYDNIKVDNKDRLKASDWYELYEFYKDNEQHFINQGYTTLEEFYNSHSAKELLDFLSSDQMNIPD